MTHRLSRRAARAMLVLAMVLVAAGPAVAQPATVAADQLTQTPLAIPSTLPYRDEPGAWFTRGSFALDPAAVPSGEVELADGTRAQIRAVEGRATAVILGQPGGPAQAAGAAAPGVASELRFVHTFEAGPGLRSWELATALEKRKLAVPPPAPIVSRYVVHYADGERIDVPVRWGESIQSWYRNGTIAPLPWAAPAWVRMPDDRRRERAVIYTMRWPNPRPEVQITSVDAVSANDGLNDYGALALLAVTAVQRPPTGRVFFVAPAPHGSDESPGSFSQPWATLHKAAGELDAGDTVYVRGGRYAIDREIAPARSGRADAWITIAGYPGEIAVIHARDHMLDPTREPPLKRRGPFDHDDGEIHLVDREFIRVQGLQIEESRRCGVYLNNCRNIELRDLVIHRTYNSAIYAGWGSDGVKIINVTAVQPTHKVMDSDLRSGEYKMTWHPAHEGISVADASNFEVAFCEVYGADKEGIDIKGPNQHGAVHHNYVHHCMAIGIYIDSHGATLGDLDVHHNTIHDACGILIASEGGTPVDDVRIHHNLIYDCPSTGISVAGSRTTNVLVANNTVVNCGFEYVSMGWSGGGIYLTTETIWDINVRDNIAAANAQFQLATLGQDRAEYRLALEHNLCEPAAGVVGLTPTADRPATTTGDRAVGGDPMFVDPAAGDMRLRDGSPAIATGRDGGDLGALPAGLVLEEGHDLAGRVLASHRGPMDYTPLAIPAGLLNGRLHHRGRRPGWFAWGTMYDYDMRQVPAGRQMLADVEWQIIDHEQTPDPSIIMVAGQGSSSDVSVVEGIPVGQAADALFFLHTYNQGAALEPWRQAAAAATQPGAVRPESPVVMNYVIHYTDDQSVTVPVRAGEHIEHWRRTGEGIWAHLSQARVAWVQPIEVRRRRGSPDGAAGRGGLMLYSMRWDNPRPQVQIRSLDIVSANTATENYGSAAILAITAGRLRAGSQEPALSRSR